MRKITVLILLALSYNCLKAQTNLDSLYTLWQDQTQKDSIRTDAFKNYIWDGFLFDKPDSAFTLAEELVTFAKTEQYPNAKAEAYNIQGVSFWLKANYLKALDYYKRSLKIREEIGDKKGISASLYNIGNIYFPGVFIFLYFLRISCTGLSIAIEKLTGLREVLLIFFLV